MQEDISLDDTPSTNGNNPTGETPVEAPAFDPLTSPSPPPPPLTPASEGQPSNDNNSNNRSTKSEPASESIGFNSSNYGPLSDSGLENVDLGASQPEVDVGAAMAAAGTELPSPGQGAAGSSTRPTARVRISVLDPVKRVSVSYRHYHLPFLILKRHYIFSHTMVLESSYLNALISGPPIHPWLDKLSF